MFLIIGPPQITVSLRYITVKSLSTSSEPNLDAVVHFFWLHRPSFDHPNNFDSYNEDLCKNYREWAGLGGKNTTMSMNKVEGSHKKIHVHYIFKM